MATTTDTAAATTDNPGSARTVIGGASLTTVETSVGPAAFQIERGRQHPLGATPDAEGVNFSLFSEDATSVELLLFNDHDDLEHSHVVTLDPLLNKSFYFWHVYVRGLKPGMHYAYRVDGPGDIHGRGHRFNRNKVLIDPYSKGNTTTLWDRGAACGPQDNLGQSMRSVIIDPCDYDWEGDKPLQRAESETVIYEMHVGGFTKSPTSGVKHPGTYAGVIEKIPYLKELGVTAVELLPVHDFDEKQVLRLSPDNGQPLYNYWGYSTVGFFAPHSAYCINPECGEHLNEFRDMVKALHKAGIEVILDVVFNHTDEGNHQGPTIHMKGLSNHTYYMLSPQNREYYMDYSGCGNTVNANHPITEKLIVDCLEYWVREMHIDGFRFDEAVILTRDENGAPMMTPPVTWQIELSEILGETKIIAECWDAAGLNEMGYFPGFRWAEWNGRYRDIVRRFVKGDPGLIGQMATRLGGSSDFYEHLGEMPTNSVNFVIAHDGFTLNDMVTYNEKHNWANGESNNDGINDNDSWNCGAEGPTDDIGINTLRERQIKNFATVLFVSQGIPMFCMGDEVRRTQNGNNNAYCQDNEIAWLNWDGVRANQNMFRFFSRMIHLRLKHSNLHRTTFFKGAVNERGVADVSWHGCRLNQIGWQDPGSRVMAFTLGGFEGDPDFHVILNMDFRGNHYELPSIAGHHWYRVVDTSLAAPHDYADEAEQVQVVGDYFANDRTVVVLISRPEGWVPAPASHAPVTSLPEEIAAPRVATNPTDAPPIVANLTTTTAPLAETLAQGEPETDPVAPDIANLTTTTEPLAQTLGTDVTPAKKPRAPRKKKTDATE